MGFFDWLRKHFPPCNEELMDHDSMERYQAENPQDCGSILPEEEQRMRREDERCSLGGSVPIIGNVYGYAYPSYPDDDDD